MNDLPKDEDEKLWGHVTKDVRPIKADAGRAVVPPAKKSSASALHVLRDRVAARMDDDIPTIKRPKPDRSSRQIDLRTAERLKKGKTPIEGRLDLHGYTLAAAQAELRRFVVRAQQQGKRCVLVVTGKGDIGAGADGERWRGGIRREMPHWLDTDPLNHIVLRSVPARSEDGGTGACYLYLRRIRPEA